MNICNEGYINSNENMLIDFGSNNDIRIKNTSFAQKLQHRQMQKVNVHRVKYTKTNFNKRVPNTEHIHSPKTKISYQNRSDHHLKLHKIRSSMQFKFKKQKSPAEIIEKLNVESISDDSTKNVYKN